MARDADRADCLSVGDASRGLKLVLGEGSKSGIETGDLESIPLDDSTPLAFEFVFNAGAVPSWL